MELYKVKINVSDGIVTAATVIRDWTSPPCLLLIVFGYYLAQYTQRETTKVLRPLASPLHPMSMPGSYKQIIPHENFTSQQGGYGK
jgi:hypothetical protein